MIGLLSTNSGSTPIEALKIVVPFGIGLASAALLAVKMTSRSHDKSIPNVPIRKGDLTHDKELNSNYTELLLRCEEEYGPVFNLKALNHTITVISDSMVREVFMNESFSSVDATETLTGIRSFGLSMIKSHKDDLDGSLVHGLVRDIITPSLPVFMPRIVEQLERVIDGQLGYCEGKVVEKPTKIVQYMVAHAMANVFMGPEVAKHQIVIDTFVHVMYDFAEVLQRSNREKSWHAWSNKTKYTMFNPLHKHVKVLVDTAGPVIEERRRQEIEAYENGVKWERSLDVMQRMLDNSEKYGFVDLEDICGHLMVLVLASIHTTTDTSTSLMYYLACFTQYHEPLFQEYQEVLGQIEVEREELRQKKLQSGEFESADEFVGTELDPARDRDLSAAALKRMVHMDSFVREIFRYRHTRMEIMHLARKPVTLSNGMRIAKGQMVAINLRSVHRSHEYQDPTEFRPWRFLGKAKAATKVAVDYLPFGMGPHACPGRFMAVQVLKAIGSLMVSRYSKIEMIDPSYGEQILQSRRGDHNATGLIFTSRSAPTKTEA